MVLIKKEKHGTVEGTEMSSRPKKKKKENKARTRRKMVSLVPVKAAVASPGAYRFRGPSLSFASLAPVEFFPTAASLQI